MATTFKVSDRVRDQLKRQAASANRTIGQHLEYLAGLGEREARMAKLRAAISATSIAHLTSYRQELETWDRLERTGK